MLRYDPRHRPEVDVGVECGLPVSRVGRALAEPWQAAVQLGEVERT